MVASQKQARNAPPDQRHDVLPDFGEWPKVQDTPVGSSALHPDGDGVSDGRDEDNAAQEFHISPSIVAAEPSIDLNTHALIIRPSMGRRISRTLARGLILIAIVGAAFAWQSLADDKARDVAGRNIVRAWELSQNWFSSLLGTELRPSSDVTNESLAKTSGRASAQDALSPQATPVAQSAPALVGVGSLPNQQDKLEIMADDLASVRRLVDQLATRQEQMAQDIETLQANVSQKLSSAPGSAAVQVSPPKNPPRIGHPETAIQSPPMPVPRPPVRAPLPLH